MKKVLILFICLILVGCGVKENKKIELKTDETKTENTIGIQKFKEEYEALNESSVKVEIDTNTKLDYLEVYEVIDLLKNKTGIIYFGFPTCPWCRNIIPILFNVAIDNDETIYYFNPQELRQTTDSKFDEIMSILDEYLETNSDGKKVLYVPDVYFVKEGKIVGHFLGSVPSQINPYEALNETQKQELYNIYSELLDNIKQ